MLIGYFALSLLVGFIGAGRRIGFFGAFMLSLILTPIIGIIITLSSTSKAVETMAKESQKQTAALQSMQQGKGVADQLKDLAALKDSGAISEEEYQAAKSKILQ